VLEYSGMLDSLISIILRWAKNTGSLLTSVILSCIGTNFTCSEQYISIIVPGRMYAQTFADKGLHPKNLSRALEDGGTLTSVFVPWNTCGVFIASTLGVGVMQYAPFAFLNFLVPIISVIFAYTGYKIVKLPKDKREGVKARKKKATLPNDTNLA
ncbi:MAG: Na+/H+ antiporter NhaC family protein, partial [Staphylococcus simulans]|nr:Na+/H+ antiporter NhaC family protein [Staphylococcus simulans]